MVAMSTLEVYGFLYLLEKVPVIKLQTFCPESKDKVYVARRYGLDDHPFIMTFNKETGLVQLKKDAWSDYEDSWQDLCGFDFFEALEHVGLEYEMVEDINDYRSKGPYECS